jgi:lipoteichoic acid synthase
MSLLPLTLILVFVLQNEMFNVWLKLYSKAYTMRLFVVAFALGTVFYLPSLLFRRKIKYIYLFLISFFISFIFVAQFLYFRYSQSFLQISAIKYFWLAGSLGGAVKSLLTPGLLLFMLNIIIVSISFALTFRKKYSDSAPPLWEKSGIIVIMFLIVFFGYKYLLDTEKKEWGSTSRLYKDVYDLNAVIGKMGILNFSIEDTFKYILRSNLITSDDRNFLQSWVEARPVATETDAKYFGEEKGKNLIIIQVESLENAIINKTIGGQEITPNLNRLAKEGLYFNNYYAQIGPGNTADAEFSTLNSLYPLPDDVVFINYAKNQFKALPKLLKSYGYGTYSFHGDVPTFWNRSNIYPGLGYEKAYSLSDFVVTRSVGQGPSDLGDQDLFSQTLPRLESFKQPFMATVITMSLHVPFILPDDLQELKIPLQTNLTQTQWEYMQAARYTDKAIGEFIDGLKNDGLYKNSLIFIWGDHGSFQNIYSALSKKNLTSDAPAAQLYKNLDVGVIDGSSWNDNILPELQSSQIPMIILSPGTNLRGTTNITGSQLDVYPTITNLLGIPAPKTILGQDLLNTKTPVETHFELVSGGIDAILTPDLAYKENKNGFFQDSTCLKVPEETILPVENCRNLYSQQVNTLKASDIIIRGNLLDALK